MSIPLPTRAELLAAVLLVERTANGVTYRYATEEDAENHLKEERRVLARLADEGRG